MKQITFDKQEIKEKITKKKVNFITFDKKKDKFKLHFADDSTLEFQPRINKKAETVSLEAEYIYNEK